MARIEKCDACGTQDAAKLWDYEGKKLCMPCYSKAKATADHKPGARRFEDDQLRELAGTCKSTAEIAEKLEVSTTAVRARARKMGLVLPRTAPQARRNKKRRPPEIASTPPSTPPAASEPASETEEPSVAPITLHTVATCEYEGHELTVREHPDDEGKLLLMLDEKPHAAMVPGLWKRVAEMVNQIEAAQRAAA